MYLHKTLKEGHEIRNKGHSTETINQEGLKEGHGN